MDKIISKMGFSKVRKWNWAAAEGSCAEKLHKGSGKHVLPPQTHQEYEQGGQIWRVIAGKKKPNNAVAETSGLVRC